MMEQESKGFTVVLVSRTRRGKRTLSRRGWHATRAGAQRIRAQWQEKSDAVYLVLGPRQLRHLQDEIKAEDAARRAKGAQKAAATRKKRGPGRFVLCPTCGAKSRKLSSEMGGLQTRCCQSGHVFEHDGWLADRRFWAAIA